MTAALVVDIITKCQQIVTCILWYKSFRLDVASPVTKINQIGAVVVV